VDGGGLAIFEAGLVDLRRYQMWTLGLDSFQYGLLHYLGQMRSHNNRSYLIKITGSLGECLLERYQSSHSEVLRDLGVVKGVCYLLHHFSPELLILGEDIPIKTVRAQSLVEVGLLSCFSYVFHGESCSGVDHLISHLFIVGHSVSQMLLHVIWSLVDPLEITCDDLVNLSAVFKHF
jgi:hypothetical protein